VAALAGVRPFKLYASLMAATAPTSTSRPKEPTAPESRPLAHWLLLGLPFVVLVVPQGTTARTLVPELAFVLFLLVTATLCLMQGTWLRPALALRRQQFQPLLLFVLAHFLLINPLWSLWQGNPPGRVAITVLPFMMLGVYYLLAIVRPSTIFVQHVVTMLAWSGALLGLIVVANYFLGTSTAPQMRSTGIQGERTLTLPLLPMAGVLLAIRAMQARSRSDMLISASAAVLILMAIVMTVTRAMLAAYLVGLVLALLLMLRHAQAGLRQQILRRLTIGLLVSAAASAPMLASWVERLDPANEGDVGTILGRIDEYTAFWTAFTESPLLGLGMGHLATYPSDFDWTLRDTGITVCHSHFFFLAGTGGIVGMALYYGLLVQALLRLLGSLANASRTAPDRMATVAGLAGSVVAGVLFTLTSTTFTALSYNLFLAIFLFCATTDWSRE
jgi:O-antigen ligase